MSTVGRGARPAFTRQRLLVALGIAAGVSLLVAANAHFVYVAVTSQPDCVDHPRDMDAASGSFRAAKSVC